MAILPLQTPVYEALVATAHLRRERGELLRDLLNIEETIASFEALLMRKGKPTDSLTLEIRGWLESFRVSLRNERQVEMVSSIYLQQLTRILQDPIPRIRDGHVFFACLDSESFLGSDGKTYGKKSLLLFLSSKSDQVPYRSPIDQNNEASFTAIAHPLARHLVNWLAEKHMALVCPEIEEEFRLLEERRTIPDIPTSFTEQIRAMRRREAGRREAEVARIAEAILRPAMAAVEGALQAAENEVRADLGEARHTVRELNREREADREAVQARIRELEAANEALERQNEELERRLAVERETLTESEIEIIKIQQTNNQTQKELNKRENDWLRNVISVVVQITVFVATGGTVTLDIK